MAGLGLHVHVHVYNNYLVHDQISLLLHAFFTIVYVGLGQSGRRTITCRFNSLQEFNYIFVHATV